MLRNGGGGGGGRGLRAEEDRWRRRGISLCAGAGRCGSLLGGSWVTFTTFVEVGMRYIGGAVRPVSRFPSLPCNPRHSGDQAFFQLGAWSRILSRLEREWIIFIQDASRVKHPWHLLRRHRPRCPYFGWHEGFLLHPYLFLPVGRPSSTLVSVEPCWLLNAPSMLFNLMRDVEVRA